MAFIGGSDGIWAMKQLQEQKQLLSAHTAAIEKTYDELSLEQIALQKDLDVIASYAKLNSTYNFFLWNFFSIYSKI